MKKCYFCARKPTLRITGEFRHQFVGHIYETDDPDRIKDIEANGFFGSWFVEVPIPAAPVDTRPEAFSVKPQEVPMPFEELSYAQLRAQAKEKGIPQYWKMKKAALIAELKELEVSDG